MNYFVAFLAVILSFSATSQSNKTFFLGHSLVNFHMPNMVNKLSIAGGKTYSYHANVGNGANLLFHWNNPTSGQGSQWDTTLPSGGFEHFIITEAVPLLGHLEWSHTYRIADSLYMFANTYNPTIQYYIYETWHCNTTGTPTGCEWDTDDGLLWRPRLAADLPKWEGIADSINLIHANDMLVIPVGQALGQLSDSIDANLVPGLTSINDLFLDNIHLTTTGNYFIACVMYGVLHKESPVGLPHQLTDEWGIPYPVHPTPEQSVIFQRIAWNTLCEYPRDGVECTLGVYNHGEETELSVVPNPTQGEVEIITNQPLNISIVTANGRSIYQNSGYMGEKIELVENGIYFLFVTDENHQTSKQKIVVVR